jgi:uncharacterized membrane protein (DUF4010 family)
MSPRRRRVLAVVLFAIPVALVVYPPLYNRATPSLDGLPFFVWYQLVVVVFAGVVTGLAYRLLARGTPSE